MDDKPADISHLVFVIHGIGQKMETGNIVKRAKEYIYFYTVVTSLLSVYTCTSECNENNKGILEQITHIMVKPLPMNLSILKTVNIKLKIDANEY